MTKYFQTSTSASPLALFRIVFGLLLFGSILRFWAKGWIYDLYINPKYFFPFYGFEYVKPLGEYTYLIFAICGISALMFAAGFFYKTASILLFSSFTYIELMDKSTYLNHYYFVSMICLVMIFLPANTYMSADAFRNKALNSDKIPKWCIDVIKIFICMVYFYAGFAKINSDWLMEAQPLRIWLPSKNDLPIIGSLFNHTWIAYAFSWIGCFYDLTIPFLLWSSRTRPWAYIAVIVFHALTAILFPIGMFPYIMIATALVFFSPGFHSKIFNKIAGIFKIRQHYIRSPKVFVYTRLSLKVRLIFFTLFFIIQIILPIRYFLYPDELFWTEEGYRFSWRVMLMEKAGYAQFNIKDKNGKFAVVNNADFLTPLQEKIMSTQPDMLLQYAHILQLHYSKKGYVNPQVYVDSYVGLNGRLGKPLVDPKIDLSKEEDSFYHKSWILSFNDEILGF